MSYYILTVLRDRVFGSALNYFVQGVYLTMISILLYALTGAWFDFLLLALGVGFILIGVVGGFVRLRELSSS